MQRRLRVVGLAAAVFGLLAGMRTIMAVPSAGPMIAEVYGGGGNSGATLTRDFIELANAGSDAASVAGWSVQYLPASPSPTSQWQVTNLSGAVPAGGRYLIGEAQGADRLFTKEIEDLVVVNQQDVLLCHWIRFGVQEKENLHTRKGF